MERALATILAIGLVSCASRPSGDPSSDLDPQIAAEVYKIKAIDNHAHPVRPTASGETPDKDYDALPVEMLEPATDPVRLRPGSPGLAEASRELFHGDPAAVRKAWGEHYAATVLDHSAIDLMVANRVSMGPGLPRDRFLWAAYADALMYPIPNAGRIHNSDQKAFFELEEQLLRRYYADSGVPSRPASLDDYLNQVVRATLERHKQGGAIAEKFEIAYLRPFRIGNPTRADAEQAWKGTGDDTALQDFIFRYIVQECGRLGMAVHIHTGVGAGSYYNIAGANPILLEPLLDDPALRKTNFVMVHGGWPFTAEITPLLQKPNAYLDFSVRGLIESPNTLAAALRGWLEFAPEKVLFGTDGYPYGPGAGWEETTYASAEAGRKALGIALTAMVRENSVSRPRATELAKMVLRDNARKLYGLK